MKKSVIAIALGVTATLAVVATSSAQQVLFDNYGAVPYFPVVYSTHANQLPAADAALVGQGVNNTFDVELGYFIGSGNASSTFTLVPSSITPINIALVAANNDPNDTHAASTGFFQGPAVTVAGYTSGAVTFEMLAWETAGPGAEAAFGASPGGLQGSLVWVEPSIPASGLPAGNFTALPGDLVVSSPVPEPTTLALAGLAGLASLVAFRRKNA
jgi:hypothetical protein